MNNWIFPSATAAIGICGGLLLGWVVFDRNPDAEEAPLTSIEKSEQSSSWGKKSSGATQRHYRTGRRRGASQTRLQSGADQSFKDTQDFVISMPSGVLDSLMALGGVKTPAGELFSKDDASLELLKITSDEQYKLNEIWERACAEAEDHEAANLHVSQDAQGVVTMVIPGVPYDAPIPELTILDEIKRVMGEDRGEVFLAAKQLRRKFEPKTGETSYTISTEFVGDGESRFHIVMEGESGRRRVWVGDSIPQKIAHLAKAAGIPVNFNEATENSP